MNRQFINIMAANGIPEELFVQIFKERVDGIKGLADRVKERSWNDEDMKLISMCSEVRFPAYLHGDDEHALNDRSFLWFRPSKLDITRIH